MRQESSVCMPQEVVGIKNEEIGRPDCRHRCRTRLTGQECDLAKEITFFKPYLACRRVYFHGSAGNEIHGITAISFAYDRSPGWNRSGSEDSHKLSDRSSVQARKERDLRDHGERDNEVAATDLFVKAASDDGHGQREAPNSKHDRDRGNEAAKGRQGRGFGTADFGKHDGCPPHGLRHVSEPIRLHRPFDGVHGSGGAEQHANKYDYACQERPPLAGDDAANGGQCRGIARKLQEAHQAREQQEAMLWKQKLEQQRHQRQRIDDHQRCRSKAKPCAKAGTLPQQRMFRRSPDSSHVFEREYEHTEAIENLQHDAMARCDLWYGHRDRDRDIGDDKKDQDQIDGARCRLPATPVLEDLEDALTQCSPALWIGVQWRIQFRTKCLPDSGGRATYGWASKLAWLRLVQDDASQV